jgi:hypothetical protein
MAENEKSHSYEKFSRKFSSKVLQLKNKSPTVRKNFLENFSRPWDERE